jgi:hypothetical protein
LDRQIVLLDVMATLITNLRMIRRIAEIYGGRSGFFGSWRLTRLVFGHVIATGAVAIGDDLIGSVAGGSVLAKLSRKFGEGVINGALTARVGIAAMQLCRPLRLSSRCITQRDWNYEAGALGGFRVGSDALKCFQPCGKLSASSQLCSGAAGSITGARWNGY